MTNSLISYHLKLAAHRLRERLARLKRGLAYGLGILSTEDAKKSALEHNRIAGWYPLVVLERDDISNQAQTIYADHPALPYLVKDACLRVEDKWNSGQDVLANAQDRALELIQEFAIEEGIELQLRKPSNKRSP